MRLYCMLFAIATSTLSLPQPYSLFAVQSAYAQNAANGAVAQAGATVGQCYVLRGKEKIRISKGFKLFPGDQVLTSQNSVTEIVYADGSNNVLQENSSISIEEFKTTIEGDRVGVKSILNMVRGKARFFFKPRPGGVDATIKTKSSVMGVRGTVFVVDEDDSTKETKIAVLSGQVAVKSADAPATTPPVLVKPNQSVSIKPNQTPSKPKELSAQEVEQISKSVTPPAGKNQDGYIPDSLELPAPEPEEIIAAAEDSKKEDASKPKDSNIMAVFIDKRTNRDPLCARYRFNDLKHLAQNFDTDTVGLGRQLAKCPANADEALYWLAFYHMGTAELNQAANVGRFLTPLPKEKRLDSMAEYDAIIFKANDGEPQQLKEKVDTKGSPYAQDGEALLVLARSLVRSSQYAQARTYYERYINLKKVKSDASDVRVEEIYSYLWAGEFSKAAKRFSDILRENISATARNDAERGYLIADAREYQPGVMREVIGFSVRLLNADKVGYSEKSGTISAHVFNDYDIKARYFTLTAAQDHKLKDTTKSQSADLLVAKRFQKIWGLGFNAGAGFSGAGNGHPLYLASVDGDYSQYNLKWKFGLFGAPLVYNDRPVRADGYNIRDNTVSVEASYSYYVSYRFALHMLSVNTGYTENNLAIRIPLLPRIPATDKLNLKLFAETESHAKGMVRYYSPKSLTIMGAGIEFDSQVLSWLRIAVQGDFGMMSQTMPSEIDSDEPDLDDRPFEKQYLAKRGNLTRAMLKASYLGFTQWKPWLSARLEAINSSEGKGMYSSNEAQLGVSYEF